MARTATRRKSTADKIVSDEQAHGHAGPHKRGAGRSFTAIHPIVRDHKPISPGERLAFGSDEEEHVADLLGSGWIAEAKDAEEALEQADFARGRAEAGTAGDL